MVSRPRLRADRSREHPQTRKRGTRETRSGAGGCELAILSRGNDPANKVPPPPNLVSLHQGSADRGVGRTDRGSTEDGGSVSVGGLQGLCFGSAKYKAQRGGGCAEGRTGSVMAKPGEQPAIKSPVRPSARPPPRQGANKSPARRLPRGGRTLARPVPPDGLTRVGCRAWRFVDARRGCLQWYCILRGGWHDSSRYLNVTGPLGMPCARMALFAAFKVSPSQVLVL